MGNSNNLIIKRTKDITDLKEVYASFMRLKKKPVNNDVTIDTPKRKQRLGV